MLLLLSGLPWCQIVSPLRADKLRAAKFRQFGGVEELCRSRPVSGETRRSMSGISSSLIGPIGTGADDAPRLDSGSSSRDSERLFCDMDRTTSPLQIGQVRRRVVNHGVLLPVSMCPMWLLQVSTYMHSAWNSCPHGKLMTRLCPSIYSSRQTTHSTCRPVYFRRHVDAPDFSLLESNDLGSAL